MMGDSCAICLNPVRQTRHTPKIQCGHMFHTSCLNSWEKNGNDRCPLCRKILNESKYKVTIKIENTSSNIQQVTTIPVQSIMNLVDQLHLNINELASTDIYFDFDNLERLNELLQELGISDTDSLVPNTVG